MHPSRPALLFCTIAILLGCGGGAGSPRTSAGGGPDVRPVERPVAPTSVPLHYEPMFSGQFSLHRRDSTITTIPGGPSQTHVNGRTAFLRVEARGGGADLQITLDSLRLDAGTAIPDDLARAAEGTSWQVSWSPAGPAGGLRPSRKTVIGEQVAGMIWLLFPLLPTDGVTEGSRWSDSTRRTISVDAFEVTETAEVSYTADRATAFSTRILGETLFRRSGESVQGGRALRMSAVGLRSSEHYLSDAGFLIRAQGTDSTSMTIQLPEGGAVPVRQVGRFSITRLP